MPQTREGLDRGRDGRGRGQLSQQHLLQLVPLDYGLQKPGRAERDQTGRKMGFEEGRELAMEEVEHVRVASYGREGPGLGNDCGSHSAEHIGVYVSTPNWQNETAVFLYRFPGVHAVGLLFQSGHNNLYLSSYAGAELVKVGRGVGENNNAVELLEATSARVFQVEFVAEHIVGGRIAEHDLSFPLRGLLRAVAARAGLPQREQRVLAAGEVFGEEDGAALRADESQFVEGRVGTAGLASRLYRRAEGGGETGGGGGPLRAAAPHWTRVRSRIGQLERRGKGVQFLGMHSCLRTGNHAGTVVITKMTQSNASVLHFRNKMNSRSNS